MRVKSPFLLMAKGTLRPEHLSGEWAVIRGSERVSAPFTVKKTELRAKVSAVYGGPDLPERTIDQAFTEAADLDWLDLIEARVDGQDHFHPTSGGGVMLVVRRDVQVGFQVKRDLLDRLAQGHTLPTGYSPKLITVEIEFILHGAEGEP